MNQKTFVVFLGEFWLFLITAGVLSWCFGSSHVSLVYVCFIFILAWYVRYDRITVMFEHYTHILVVFFICFVLGVCTTVLTEDYYDSEVVALASVIWVFLASALRFVMIRIPAFQYVILTHPEYEAKLARSSKTRLISSKRLVPELLRSIDALVVDRKYNYDQDWRDLILHASVIGKPVINLSEYEEYIHKRISLRELKQNWLHAGFYISPAYRCLKYMLELVFCLAVLPVVLLLGLIIIVGIYVTMGRPIFYNQYRMGMDGKLIKVYKFRSMRQVKGVEGETTENDVRVTPFGALIRRLRIDELPQFLNIFRGNMSLIGPRPEWVETARDFEQQVPLYRLRYLVKPGITGWAQVKMGHAVGADENYAKLRYDMYYVKHFSFILDVKIMIMTVYTVLTGFGAK